ncbi:hypothetical protein BCR34DRAFT_517526 [Clohesyomyces aquaticus]|uniref:Rhodopsin domain-containing protein n=1 Tax=Clohesyomyces aquaticus TaxID=1231657 RepID=A0A1Y1ZF52_9PLEO|nr:hypothetical protein BCR34DRAFT_517526 [Clohesyomyces aquaticus]
MLHFSDRNVMITYNLTEVLICLLVVALRFWSRAVNKSPVRWDDWSIVISFVCLCGNAGVGLYVAENGLNVTRETAPLLSLGQYMLLVQLMLASILLYVVGISFARFSVLLLYHRIFSCSQRFVTALWVIGGISMAWLVTAVLVTVFQCIPVKAAWDPRVPGKCMNEQNVFLSTEIINLLLDISIVWMPTIVIKNLHLPLRDKIAMSVMFLLGGFVGVTSILRIVFTYKPHLPTYDVIGSLFWLDLQLSCGIVCACLPTLRPSIRKLMKATTSVKSWMSSKRSGDTGRSQSKDSSMKQYSDLDGKGQQGQGRVRHWFDRRTNESATEGLTGWDSTALTTIGKGSMHSGTEDNTQEPEAIHVRNEVSVV